MKDQIKKCVEYLRSISLHEPVNIRVEQIVGQTIVLSYQDDDFSWSPRIYKEFEWENAEGKIIAMRAFNS